MSKNIFIVVLVVISMGSSVFAIHQMTEARRQQELAELNFMEAQKQRTTAESAREEAENQRAAAAAAMAEVERQLKQALEKCK